VSLDHRDPSLLFRKPEPRAATKKREERQADAARLACVIAVWERAKGRCEYCGAPVYTCQRAVAEATGAPVSDFWKVLGHVHEEIPRSRGGDPTNPDHCKLSCTGCHFPGPSGGHR